MVSFSPPFFFFVSFNFGRLMFQGGIKLPLLYALAYLSQQSTAWETKYCREGLCMLFFLSSFSVLRWIQWKWFTWMLNFVLFVENNFFYFKHTFKFTCMKYIAVSDNCPMKSVLGFTVIFLVFFNLAYS